MAPEAYRHGGKDKAEAFFLNGMTQAMHRLSEQAHQISGNDLLCFQTNGDKERRHCQHRLGYFPRRGYPYWVCHHWHFGQ